MADNLIELTDATFDEIVHNSEMPVLVDFWAPWCGPCKMLGPIVEEIANEYVDKAKVCKINTDEARDSAIEFGINDILTQPDFGASHIPDSYYGAIVRVGAQDNILVLLGVDEGGLCHHRKRQLD